MEKKEKRIFVEPSFTAMKVEMEGFCVTSGKDTKAKVSSINVESYEEKNLTITFE